MDKNIENKFTKALMYLDRNKTDIAKNILNEILEISKTDGNKLYYVKINTVLGELYFRENDNIIAKKYLLNALNTDNESDDILDYEKKICKELLEEINKSNKL
jgi:Tfp pilus assembly protein PilF